MFKKKINLFSNNEDKKLEKNILKNNFDPIVTLIPGSISSVKVEGKKILGEAKVKVGDSENEIILDFNFQFEIKNENAELYNVKVLFSSNYKKIAKKISGSLISLIKENVFFKEIAFSILEVEDLTIVNFDIEEEIQKKLRGNSNSSGFHNYKFEKEINGNCKVKGFARFNIIKHLDVKIFGPGTDYDFDDEMIEEIAKKQNYDDYNFYTTLYVFEAIHFKGLEISLQIGCKESIIAKKRK